MVEDMDNELETETNI